MKHTAGQIMANQPVDTHMAFTAYHLSLGRKARASASPTTSALAALLIRYHRSYGGVELSKTTVQAALHAERYPMALACCEHRGLNAEVSRLTLPPLQNYLWLCEPCFEVFVARGHAVLRYYQYLYWVLQQLAADRHIPWDLMRARVWYPYLAPETCR
jgi:hypothetical protein